MTEVETNDATILFSYQTPVAACLKDGTGFARTAEHFSVTTSGHINKWLDGAKARTEPQSFFDALGGAA